MAGALGTRRAAGARLRRDPAGPLHHVDFALLAATIALSGIGLLMVYSSTQHRLESYGSDPNLYLQRQAVWLVLGVIAMVTTALVDYRLLRDYAPVIYIGAVFALLMVLTPLGSSSKGTQAWFQLGGFQFQPSEWSKVGLIICAAAYCSRHPGDIDAARLHVVLGLMAVPMGLIYLQPDFGTTVIFAVILMGMLLVAGAHPRHLAALVLLAVVGVIAVLQFGVLKQYQLDRLGAFLDPKGDTKRAAYNIDQSKTAIGAGGFRGKGWLKGSQTNLSFVPEQHTDFIFTAVGEELGFVGAALLLLLFALLVWRTWRIALLARDDMGTLVCVGVLVMLVFQIFENIGMTMGIMPVVGIPLPFLSYGGSSTIASFAAIGLVQNVHMRRFQ